MDVMRAFDIKVTFHLEPYSGNAAPVCRRCDVHPARVRRTPSVGHDVAARDADGRASPVFKSFVTLLSPTSTDCQGITRPVDIYVPDNVWGQQMARVRGDVARDFAGITFVADSLDADRTRAAGFDAGAVGNPYIRPDEWAAHTAPFDRETSRFLRRQRRVRRRRREDAATGSCYQPLPFEPELNVRWDRQSAGARAAARRPIASSLERTLAHQTDPQSATGGRDSCTCRSIRSSEWHEGTAFEPMMSYRDLSSSGRLLYHNTTNGSYRLRTLRNLLELVRNLCAPGVRRAGAPVGADRRAFPTPRRNRAASRRSWAGRRCHRGQGTNPCEERRRRRRAIFIGSSSASSVSGRSQGSAVLSIDPECASDSTLPTRMSIAPRPACVEHLEALSSPPASCRRVGDGAPDLSALGQKSADREQDDGRWSIREGTGRLAQRRIRASARSPRRTTIGLRIIAFFSLASGV
jgi:hypothetical protein